MKLTNISLAILVAIGLVACGGSDDKNNQTTDNNNAGNHNTGNNNPPPPPPKGDSGLDPKRVAPGLTVPDDMKAIVAANKRVFLDRGFSDTALGYAVNGSDYDKFKGTDPANIKLASTYNFSEESDLISSSVKKQANYIKGALAADYTDASVGAIYVGSYDAMRLGTANAFVKSGDKYIRVKGNIDPADGKFEYSPQTEFYDATEAQTPKQKPSIKTYPQSEVVFIANVADNVNELELGKDVINKYNLLKGQVLLDSVTVFGKTYAADTIGDNLNFGSLEAMRDIQTTNITGSYTIINNKNTAPSTDDKRVPNSISLGKMKAYNLPYSIAFVTTNLDEKKPTEKNIFNLGNSGAFQVLGFETVSLPQNGRTFYKGKSFSANVTGDVTLFADLFEDRAGIGGVIDNRKDSKGKELATLTLEKTEFQKLGGIYATSTTGNVKGDPGYANKWTVQLYGPDAEEAAGTIYKSGAPDVTKEVFNTQREGLTNQSNDSTVTP